jgi:hypothetical protein
VGCTHVCRGVRVSVERAVRERVSECACSRSSAGMLGGGDSPPAAAALRSAAAMAASGCSSSCSSSSLGIIVAVLRARLPDLRGLGAPTPTAFGGDASAVAAAAAPASETGADADADEAAPAASSRDLRPLLLARFPPRRLPEPLATDGCGCGAAAAAVARARAYTRAGMQDKGRGRGEREHVSHGATARKCIHARAYERTYVNTRALQRRRMVGPPVRRDDLPLALALSSSGGAGELGLCR